MVGRILLVGWALLVSVSIMGQDAAKKQKIKALYIPLADHYAGIVAYEKYAKDMTHADFTIEKMKSWAILRAYFMAGEADVAFIICPEAMDMFLEKQNFRWVSLLHRDGNALTISSTLGKDVVLDQNIAKRKPNKSLADAIKKRNKLKKALPLAGVPHIRATHTVILYKYCKDYGLEFHPTHKYDNDGGDLDVIEVPPPESPRFLKRQNSRAIPAVMDQSLPWPNIIEANGLGKIAWFSKDVLPWKHGHVECIMIASDAAVKNKRNALKEVISAIHRAGVDIENGRKNNGQTLPEIIKLIRKHVPEHDAKSITQSLSLDTNGINYLNLNVDANSKGNLKQIMDLAVESKLLKKEIDIDTFADSSFSTTLTKSPEKTKNKSDDDGGKNEIKK